MSGTVPPGEDEPWFSWGWIVSRLVTYLLVAATFALAFFGLAGVEALRRAMDETPLTAPGGLLACVAGAPDDWPWHLATLVALALGIEGVTTRGGRRRDGSGKGADDPPCPGQR